MSFPPKWPQKRLRSLTLLSQSDLSFTLQPLPHFCHVTAQTGNVCELSKYKWQEVPTTSSWQGEFSPLRKARNGNNCTHEHCTGLSSEPNNYSLGEFSCAHWLVLVTYMPSQMGREDRDPLSLQPVIYHTVLISWGLGEAREQKTRNGPFVGGYRKVSACAGKDILLWLFVDNIHTQ